MKHTCDCCRLLLNLGVVAFEQLKTNSFMLSVFVFSLAGHLGIYYVVEVYVVFVLLGHYYIWVGEIIIGKVYDSIRSSRFKMGWEIIIGKVYNSIRSVKSFQDC